MTISLKQQSASLEKSELWLEHCFCRPGLVFASIMKMTEQFSCISEDKLQTSQRDISTHQQFEKTIGNVNWEKILNTYDGPAIGTSLLNWHGWTQALEGQGQMNKSTQNVLSHKPMWSLLCTTPSHPIIELSVTKPRIWMGKGDNWWTN